MKELTVLEVDYHEQAVDRGVDATGCCCAERFPPIDGLIFQ